MSTRSSPSQASDRTGCDSANHLVISVDPSTGEPSTITRRVGLQPGQDRRVPANKDERRVPARWKCRPGCSVHENGSIMKPRTWRLAETRPAKEARGWQMNREDFPAPKDGFVSTHFLVAADQDRSRTFYQRLLDGQVVVERDPVIIKVANSWLILNEGGGPPTTSQPSPSPRPPIPTAPPPSSTSGSPTSTGPTGSGRQRAQSSSPSQRTTDARSAPTSVTPTVTSSRSA
jgi:hypothetical protein